MTSPRASGVLLHPTSLPGPFGIGDLGLSATAFVEFLVAAGQRVWQVLPLGPTGYGDSPYQSLSAFAGNPLLVSLDALVDDGWLTEAVARTGAPPSTGSVSYEHVIAHRRAIWPRLLDRLDAAGSALIAEPFTRFCRGEAHWLDDFALFMAVKEAHGQRAWTAWERDIAMREPDAVARWTGWLRREVRQHKLTQYLFFTQWERLRQHSRARGVELLGDLPIFVAHDSADVWAQRELFQLDAAGQPTKVAGVPPDYFSATGQLWGNPHYDWARLAATGYDWWIRRVRALLTLVDRIRLDHFRGFVAAWEIPADATTAVDGQWRLGPGAALFEAMEGALLRPLPFIAENLGVITPEVETLRQRFQLPGMAVLQFAFGTDPQAPDFRPHNYERRLAVYTGTHDNDTTVGWWTGAPGHSTRSEVDVQRERELASRYLAVGPEVHWDLIRAALASVAHLAIIPAQDLLGLGSEARMNQPGTLSNNWRWQLGEGQLTAAIAYRLRRLSDTYDRS